MIEKLTSEQEAFLEKHKKEYLAWSFSCEPLDKKSSCSVIGQMYEKVGKNKPYFWVCQSPFQILLVITVLKNIKDPEFNLGANLRDNLRANLWANFINNSFWGQMDAFWVSYYIYPERYLNIDYKEYSKILSLWDILVKSCGWWYPFEKICFISDRPKEIHNKGVQLHNEAGPALLFRDGYSLWFLNGVDVGEKIVMTPAEKLDAKLMLTTKNAEVRREIVRKMGIELVCQRLGAKCIDKREEYELLMLELGDGRRRPYLKMLNPSIGIYHIEGVHPDCDTVKKALNWRNQTEEEPIILT